MNIRHSYITHQFETTLNIEEKFLSSIKVYLLAKSKTNDTLHTYGLSHLGLTSTEGLYPELRSNFSIISFKKISKEASSEKYKIYFNIGLYVETDTANLDSQSFYGNSVGLIVVIYYKNNRGNYESRKYQI